MSDMTGQMEIVGRRTDEGREKVSMGTRASITKTHLVVCFPLLPLDGTSFRMLGAVVIK